ncbi:thiol-disulfide oxidoreductase LTO1 [Elaeis guineensis]|uniref:Thiol-disulfide oxidoreductase LTO1 isoform X2 n=1 Tax=Elaeis guineensis var. tenera TaxID=51953 RepID=A0A6I9Q910_ELAGV|nr:thiol-disulfide oxidoreductase LTO1 isoform X2 [Elaeis guineensis]
MTSISAALAISHSPTLSFARTSPISTSPFKRTLGCPLKCWAGPSPEVDTEDSKKTSLWGISTSTWCAGLGTLGFLETGYLTYSKLTDSEAFCPVGGGSCSDVLNSDYSFVFGVPLPLVGMLAYGLVTLLSLQQTRKHLLNGLGEADARLILLGTTTSMATASAYFVYLLSTTFAGTSCSYCLISAVLSFILFFITVKDFGLEEIQKVVGLQLVIAGIVVSALTNSYTTATQQFSGSNDITLEPYEIKITSKSTPFAISLAKYLRSIGAKMYGAFWCSHCNEQKQMFGREAAKILDYVECFPDGAGKGRKMAKECSAVGIEGFPTWVIKDKVLSGEQELPALAEASGFILADFYPS